MDPADPAQVARFFTHNSQCIGCGAENPLSLGFRPEHTDSRTLRSAITFAPAHQGGPALSHGGVIATALDEALGRAACVAVGSHAVTARLELKYIAPASVEGQYEVHAHVDSIDGRRVRVSGTLRGADGAPIAEATGLWITVPNPV